MDPAIEKALSHNQVLDITTRGRRTGQARRIEIYLHRLGDRLYISGIPRPQKRAWLANLEADPRLTLHVREPAVDLPATARVIDDEAERRRVLPGIAAAWGRTDLEAMVAWSPLIEVSVARAAESRSAA